MTDCYIPTSPCQPCIQDEFIPIVYADEDEKSSDYEVFNLTCKEGTCLSEYIEKDLVKQPLYGVYIEKDTVVRFVVKKGNPATNDGKGNIEAKPLNTAILSRTNITEATYANWRDWHMIFRISYASTKKNAFIDFYATNNPPTEYSNIHCGRVAILASADKDVFKMNDYDLFNEENKVSMAHHALCFQAVDNQFAKVVNDPALILGSYASLSGYDRVNAYSKLGYVQSVKKFGQSEIWKRANEDDYQLKPFAYKDGKQAVFSDHIKAEVAQRAGYHIYHFILLNGYHVLALVVDSRNPCAMKYRVLDQIRDRPWHPISNLDTDFLDLTNRNYTNACDSARRKDHNSDIQLAKLKTK